MSGTTEIDEAIESITNEIVEIKKAMESIGISMKDTPTKNYPMKLDNFYYPESSTITSIPSSTWDIELEQFKLNFKKVFAKMGQDVSNLPFTEYHNVIKNLKKNTTMTMTTATSVAWGVNTQVKITLKDEVNNSSIKNAPIVLSGGGLNTTQYTDSNGVTTFTFTNQTPGSYTYTFKYNGNSQHRTKSLTQKITFKKRDLTLTYNTPSIIYKGYIIKYKVVDKSNTSKTPTGLKAVLNINGTKSTVNISNGQFLSSKIDSTDGKQFSSTCTIQNNNYYNIPSLPTKTSTYKEYAKTAILASSITRESKPYTPDVTNKAKCQKKGVTWAQWFVGSDNLNNHRTKFTYSNTSTVAKCWLAASGGSTVNKTPAVITGSFKPNIPNGSTIQDVRFYINDKRDSTTTIGKPKLKTKSTTYTFSSAPGTSYGHNYISLKSLYNSANKLNDGVTVQLSYPVNTKPDCGYIYLTTFVLYIYYIPSQN